MTTISGVVSSGVYVNNASSQNARSLVAAMPDVGVMPAASPSSLVSAFTSLAGTSDSPLTYNAAGMFNSFQQANLNTPATRVQSAQNAVFAAQNTVSQTLASLMSGLQSNSPGTDIFGSNTRTSDLFGLNGGSPADASAGTSNMTAQAAQRAYLAAENVITQALI